MSAPHDRPEAGSREGGAVPRRAAINDPGDGVLIHQGVVLAVDSGRARIAVDTGGCASCGHGGSCGIGRLAAARRRTVVEVAATGAWRPGTRVSLQLDEAQLALGAVLGYLLPALGLLAGALAGDALGGTDASVAAGAAAGAAVVLLALGRTGKRLPQAVARPLPIHPISLTATENHHG